MFNKIKNMATGKWNAAASRVKAEARLNADEVMNIKDKFVNRDLGMHDVTGSGHSVYPSRLIKYDEAIADSFSGKMKLDKRVTASAPTMLNAGLRSFTSKGMGKGAGYGAAAGALYGAFSSDESITAGAIKGATFGAIGKGLMGIAGERKTLYDMNLNERLRVAYNNPGP